MIGGKFKMNIFYQGQYLSHYGVLGMKWGVRRYQNRDGSLTPAGKKRYSSELQADIYNAAKQAKKNKLSVSSQVKTRDENYVRTRELLVKNGQKIVDRYNSIEKIAKEETNKAMKDPNFKNEVEKELNNWFGNGVDDKEYFDMARDSAIFKLLDSGKYTPETNSEMTKLRSEINAFIDSCEKEVKRIVSDYGNKKISKIEKGSITYEDVINEMLARDVGIYQLSFLGRQGQTYFFDEITNGSSVYTMDEYNKKYGR